MRRSRRTTAVVSMAVLSMAVLSLAACADDGVARPTATTTGTAPTTTSTPPPPSDVGADPGSDEFAGSVDDFYRVPDPLPPGSFGDLIRTQRVGGPDSRTVRIMYLSTDANGLDRAVTGLVTTPSGEQPAGGWPVLTEAPGTVGLSSSCALSRVGAPVPTFGLDVVSVATDYVGMGPIGETMPYLSRYSEGHSVLDAARAARNLMDGQASSELLIFGHSQGGHGAQSAHELAAGYAAEFDLLGTVSAAPAAMFDRTYGGVDDVVSRIVTTMGLYGLATEHPDIAPSDYLSPEAAAVAAPVIADQCLGPITDALVPLAVTPTYWTADPRTVEPARSILLANDVGNVRADAPMLLIGGTKDERVVEARVRDTFARLCGVGQSTNLLVVDGADHGTEVPMASDLIGAWFGDRLERKPAVDDCPATGD